MGYDLGYEFGYGVDMVSDMTSNDGRILWHKLHSLAIFGSCMIERPKHIQHFREMDAMLYLQFNNIAGDRSRLWSWSSDSFRSGLIRARLRPILSVIGSQGEFADAEHRHDT